mmetsp:Transcript_2977/g.8056  ORF Transcript_2977/g.8056 Transcript_2977/m.8056 type:complete len:214 (+) Transcript_2977:1225-1866(+)
MDFTPSMVAKPPSTLFETMSRAPLSGFVATPMMPFAKPLAKPFAPSFLAPCIGFVKIPEIPDTSPLARDSPPLTSPSARSSTGPVFLDREFSNLSSSESVAAALAMEEIAPVVTFDTVFNEMPLKSIGRICLEKSLDILEERTLMKTDCFSFKLRISQLFKMLIGNFSMLAKFKPNLLTMFKFFGLDFASVWKLMCACRPATVRTSICMFGSA